MNFENSLICKRMVEGMLDLTNPPSRTARSFSLPAFSRILMMNLNSVQLLVSHRDQFHPGSSALWHMDFVSARMWHLALFLALYFSFNLHASWPSLIWTYKFCLSEGVQKALLVFSYNMSLLRRDVCLEQEGESVWRKLLKFGNMTCKYEKLVNDRKPGVHRIHMVLLMQYCYTWNCLADTEYSTMWQKILSNFFLL